MNNISYDSYSEVRDHIEEIFIAARDAMTAAAWLDDESSAHQTLETKYCLARGVLDRLYASI